MRCPRFIRFAFMAALRVGAVGSLALLLGWAYVMAPGWAGQADFTPGGAIGCPEVSERPRLHDNDGPANPEPLWAQPPLPAKDRAEGGAPDAQTKGGGRNKPLDATRPVQEPPENPFDAVGTSADEEAEAVLAEASAASAPSGEPARVTVRLFDTVEFKRPLSSLPAWLDLLRRNKMAPIFVPGKYFKKGVSWEDFRDKAKGKSPVELLRYVNSFWNTWPYKTDMANWGREDYWETPDEFLKKSGDCEDYSIIKYFTLKELGIPPESMRIVVVRDTIRNLAHGILAVYLNNDAYILDNLSNAVLSHSRLRQYSPQYSVNEFGRWAHLKGRKIN